MAKRGQPPFRPSESDRTLVTALAGIFSHEDIASQIGPRGIDPKTLRRCFAHELESGKARVNAICVTGIVKAMQEGQPWALCFYAKTRMGWRETVKAVFSGEDGGPIEVNVTSAKELLTARIAGVAARIRTEPGDRRVNGSGGPGDPVGLARLRGET